MKYLVKDEDGLAIRSFASKAEAVAFCQVNWSIYKLPPKPKVDVFALVGECLF
ncbi:MAG: hypothetical protein ACO28K_09290 [Bacteroidia bacterium]